MSVAAVGCWVVYGGCVGSGFFFSLHPKFTLGAVWASSFGLASSPGRLCPGVYLPSWRQSPWWLLPAVFPPPPWCFLLAAVKFIPPFASSLASLLRHRVLHLSLLIEPNQGGRSVRPGFSPLTSPRSSTLCLSPSVWCCLSSLRLRVPLLPHPSFRQFRSTPQC